MRVAVVSDIHGNRQALEAVLDAVEAETADELWCLGDLVGYGADPDACVALIRRYATVSLAGNHDLAVRGDIPLDEFSPGAALAARWTRETIDPDALAWLRTLEPQKLDEAVGLYHASPRDPVWEYVLSPLQAELCFDVLRHRIACIGHSHIALAYTRGDGMPATGEKRAERDAARSRRRRVAARTPAASASRATATRAPPGCCSTPTPGRPPSTAPNTTSRRPPPRSAGRTSPARSRTVCCTASRMKVDALRRQQCSPKPS